MRKPNILTLSLSIVLVFTTIFLTSCTKSVSPEQARDSLRKLNTTYTNLNDFLNYTQKGDLAVVTLFLQAGADANLTNSDKVTALMIAADEYYPTICKLLLDQGADVNARDSQDRTALGIATLRGQSEIVKMLLDKGADANSKNKGIPVLVTAFQQGKADIAKLLIDKGADINAKVSEDDTLLTLAVANSQLETVKLLLKGSVNVNAQVGKNNETALTRAASQTDINILKELLSAKAEVNAKPTNGNTALINSVIKGNANNTDLLLQNGANVDSKIADRESILAYAIRNNLTPIVQTLLNHKVSVSQDDLIKASDKADMAKLFVSKGYINSKVASNVKRLYQKYLANEVPVTDNTPIYKSTPNSSEVQNTNTSKTQAPDVPVEKTSATQTPNIMTEPKIFNIQH